jgi:cob(I)alamin adenosyltransferase
LEPHIEAAKEGWKEVLSYLNGDSYADVLILDELCVVLSLGLLDAGEVMTRIVERPHGLEVICTGRDAPEELITAADLVTEMREVKHYFREGIDARKGIEY